MMIVKVEKLIITDLLHRNQDEKNEQRRSRKSSYSPWHFSNLFMYSINNKLCEMDEKEGGRLSNLISNRFQHRWHQ